MSGPRGLPAPPPRAVLFDMDGTLTEPLLDFAQIKREIGLRQDLPILEQLETAEPEARRRAEQILDRHEREAISRATLAEGCRELLALLEELDTPAAILTRNSRPVVDTFVRSFGFRFAAIHSREDGPPKPAPDGALRLCRLLGVIPADALVVGDFRFDILAGLRAGCRTALIVRSPPRDLAEWGPPDLVLPSLQALARLWRPGT